MKEKLTRNLGLKVLSIILAAILWLVITNVDDPITAKTFNNVPVEVINEDALEASNQVYEITEGATIDFTFAARRSVKDNLTVSDFQVTADFSKLSDVNAVNIDIRCPRYGDEVKITDGQYQVMKVNLEELASKNFKVNIIQKGEPADGYYVYEKKTNGTLIQVSGPKSKIERIDQIVCEVDVSDVAGTFKTTEEPKALDEDGNEIDSSNLDFSDRSVSVSIGMYKTKTIDLTVSTTGEPANGYVMTTVEYDPKTIEVTGEDLRDIFSLNIPADVSGAYQNIKEEVNIQEQLPEGVILVGDNQTVTINVGIVRAETKEFLINPGDIDVYNKPVNLELMYMTIGPISVLVKGPADQMATLSQNDLKLSIDLINYSSGTYEVPIKFEAFDYYRLDNEPIVRIYLKQ